MKSLLRYVPAYGLLASALLLSPAHGSLLVYEGFVGYSGTLSGATPNANTIGLNQSTAYAGTNLNLFTVNSSSLSFGSNFLTNGGSVTTTTGTAVSAAKLSLASAYTGTLYSSFLISLANNSTANGNGALIRVSDTTTNTGEHFNVYADSRNNASISVAAANGSSATVTGSGTSLALNTTYLLISKYTNVGSAASTTTVFALSLAQYGNFLSAGATESYLTSTAMGSAANQITARVTDSTTATSFGFSSSNYVQMVSVGDASTFDEMRYGSTLADVVAVPEPSTWALLAAGALLLIRGVIKTPRRIPAKVRVKKNQ